MRATLAVLLLAPSAVAEYATYDDPARDQADAPLYGGYDLASINMTASSDGSGRGAHTGEGLQWAVRFQGGIDRIKSPSMEDGEFRVSAALNGTATTMTQTYILTSEPPIYPGNNSHPDFGPEACVFTDIVVETIHDGDVIDRLPDAGGLTYDACWLFPQPANETAAPIPEPAATVDAEPGWDGGMDAEAPPPDESIPVPLWPILAIIAAAARRH